MDYETFGIYKKRKQECLISNAAGWKFGLSSEVINEYKASDVYDAQNTISWEDKAKECVFCEKI